jgi:hypothetical protein
MIYLGDPRERSRPTPRLRQTHPPQIRLPAG